MTRIACKLGSVVALGLGVLLFAASPAQAHPHGHHHYWGPSVIVAPRFVVPAYYGPRVAVVAAPAPVIIQAYPAPVYAPAPYYVVAPAPVVGAAIRVGPVGFGVSGTSVGVGIGIR